MSVQVQHVVPALEPLLASCPCICVLLHVRHILPPVDARVVGAAEGAFLGDDVPAACPIALIVDAVLGAVLERRMDAVHQEGDLAGQHDLAERLPAQFPVEPVAAAVWEEGVDVVTAVACGELNVDQYGCNCQQVPPPPDAGVHARDARVPDRPDAARPHVIDAGPDDECAESDDRCAGETICHGGQCVSAYGRVYQLVIDEVRVDERRVDGECWDMFCGAPDPMVVVTLNGVENGRTLSSPDTFFTEFAREPFLLEVIAGSFMTVSLQDEDAVGSEPILACNVELTAPFLRHRELFCQSDSGSLWATIGPR